MKRLLPFLKPLLVLVVIVALAMAADALAKGKPGGGTGDCPRTGILCPLNYDPVTCDDGVTYSNACFAFVACATGCTEGGAGS